MRLLHVTDLHLNTAWFDWVVRAAPQFDAVCISGDLLNALTFHERGKSGERQARWVMDWTAEFPRPLFICSGNHDYWISEDGTHDFAEAGWLQKCRRKNVWVDGDCARYRGWTFYCKPWVGGELPAGSRTVMLAHGPPENAACPADETADRGDFETTQLVAGLAPGSIVLSGHIHEPETWYQRIGGVHCLNPGYADSRRCNTPNHCVVDLAAGSAEFIRSATSAGNVSLSS